MRRAGGRRAAAGGEAGDGGLGGVSWRITAQGPRAHTDWQLPHGVCGTSVTARHEKRPPARKSCAICDSTRLETCVMTADWAVMEAKS